MLSTQALGIHGEDVACKYLEEKGYVLLFKNWICDFGEIDIIAREKETLVFIEVKTRYDSVFSRKHLFDAIHYRKQRKLSALVQIFIKKYYHSKKVPDFRVDAIGILLNKKENHVSLLKHIRAVI